MAEPPQAQELVLHDTIWEPMAPLYRKLGANPNEKPNAKWWEGGDHKANSNLISGAPFPSVKIGFWQVDIIFFFPYVSNSNFMMELQVYMGGNPCEDNFPQKYPPNIVSNPPKYALTSQIRISK